MGDQALEKCDSDGRERQALLLLLLIQPQGLRLDRWCGFITAVLLRLLSLLVYRCEAECGRWMSGARCWVAVVTLVIS